MERDGTHNSGTGELPEADSQADSPQMSFRRKIGRLLFRRGDREAAIYTLDDFTKEQFLRVVADFSAWYEVAKSPNTAVSHPLVVERFQGTLDPEDVQDIFRWWEEGLNELLDALELTREVLESGVDLKGPPMEKVLSIMFHANNCVDSLLRELDQSRYEGA